MPSACFRPSFVSSVVGLLPARLCRKLQHLGPRLGLTPPVLLRRGVAVRCSTVRLPRAAIVDPNVEI